MTRFRFCLVLVLLGNFVKVQAEPASVAYCNQLLTLVHLSATDFSAVKGTVAVDEPALTNYAVTPALPALRTTREFISAPKNKSPSYYYGEYVGEEAVKAGEAGFTALGTILAGKTNVDYIGFSADSRMSMLPDQHFVAYLFYDQIAVATFNRAPDGKTAWLYVGLIYSRDLARDKGALTPHVEATEPVSKQGDVVIIKGAGPRFDGGYDLTKLPPDGCISGNCQDGPGRRLIVHVTDSGLRVRMIEGKYKGGVFLGDGVMLIDGEGPILDGTYEFGLFKKIGVESMLALSTFHSKYYREPVKGYLSGHYDYTVLSDQPGYQPIIRADAFRWSTFEFKPLYHEAKDKLTVWEREIFQPVSILRDAKMRENPGFKAAVAQAAADREREYGPQNGPVRAVSIPVGANERLKLPCDACGGKGKISRTEFSYGVKGQTTRTVFDTCYKCGGSGVH